MENETALELRVGQMELYTPANGRITSQMAKESSNTPTAISIKAIGRMEWQKVMESMIEKTEVATKVIG